MLSPARYADRWRRLGALVLAKIPHYLATLAAGAMLAGCGAGDPAAQPPAELVPGQYALTRSAGGTLGKFPVKNAKKDRATVCFDSDRAEAAVERMVREGLIYHGQCEIDQAPRTGNLIRGTVTCTADQRQAPGAMVKQEYQAVIAAEAIRLEADMQLVIPPEATAQLSGQQRAEVEMAAKASGLMGLTVEAARRGGCGGDF